MKEKKFDIGIALRNMMMDERQAKYEEECERRYAEIDTGNVFPYYNAVCKDCEYRRHLGGRCVPLYVNENDNSSWATLQHEIFHFSVALMKKVGIPLSDDTEEAYAYLIGYVTKSVVDKFRIKCITK